MSLGMTEGEGTISEIMQAMEAKHIPFIEQAGEQGSTDPLSSGDIQYALFLHRTRCCLVCLRRNCSRADDRAHVSVC
jgi:hypothetical protein